MAIDAKRAAQDIMAEVVAAEGAGGAADAMALDTTPAGFCTIWPKAKPILTTVATLIILFPGLGKAASGVLLGLIKIGDQISGEVCK